MSEFQVNGFAKRSALSCDYWLKLFSELEVEQKKFFLHLDQILPSSYSWPKNPLHTWSRVWEYPYVYQNLANMAPSAQVLDYGAGVTFFPFLLSRLGMEVTCVDIDPVCIEGLSNAKTLPEYAESHVHPKLHIPGSDDLGDQVFDVIYSISVLEHIPEKRQTIEKLVKALKPSGKLIVTADIDLRGDSEIGVEAFYSMMGLIEDLCKPIYDTALTHPMDLLTSRNSIFKHKHQTTKAMMMNALSFVYNNVTRRKMKGWGPSKLGLYCGIFEKR